MSEPSVDVQRLNDTKVDLNKNQMTLSAFDWYHLAYDVCVVVKLAR